MYKIIAVLKYVQKLSTPYFVATYLRARLCDANKPYK